jgi:hypothetical protein
MTRKYVEKLPADVPQALLEAGQEASAYNSRPTPTARAAVSKSGKRPAPKSS